MEKFFEEITKLLYFYIEDNEQNSITLLTSDFCLIFSLLNGKQLSQVIEIIYIAMKNIIKVKFELANLTDLIKFLKKILKKISLDENNFKNNHRFVLKILKILKIISKLKIQLRLVNFDQLEENVNILFDF